MNVKLVRLLTVCVLCALLVVAFTSCSSKKVVSRVDAETTIDLSGNWNDTDSRLVADEMITDALAKPWLVNFVKVAGANPAVIVGAIKNLTDEHIATGTFVGDIERAFVNSGNVRVVAKKDEREGVREERADQQANASPETVKEFGMELGADYMLIGEMNKIVDQEGKEKVAFYQVDLTLTDLKTNEKVWMGQKKLKKYIARKAYKP
ncbi:penicillin-binding protein activator LpoB [candidate division KSB1 bacterium]|nr:MAG: penicillin-binding protein activator LpoB [candidate division KSB1 bacterium]